MSLYMYQKIKYIELKYTFNMSKGKANMLLKLLNNLYCMETAKHQISRQKDNYTLFHPDTV